MNQSPVTLQQIDATLDEATLKQVSFKPGAHRNICVSIVKHLLRDKICWGDELPIPVLKKQDKNCIGMSFRRLEKLELIHRMDEHHRRSLKEGQRGRLVFKYRIGNERLAKTFLKRNNATVFRRSVEELDLEPKGEQ